jgi:hypothetical protein
MTARQRISLDGTWDFWKDPGGEYSASDLPDAKRRQIQVPAPWQTQLEEAERMDFGTGWYQRVFDLPRDGPDSSVWVLHIGAADFRSDVWLNGEHMGQNEGGYLPFELDLTQAARPGENTLVVRVVDLESDFFEAPHGKQSWYGSLSGIWMPVWVEQRPATHLRGVKITPSGEQVEVEARFNRSPESGRLVYRVTAPGGEQAAAGEVDLRPGSAVQPFSFQVPAPLLWSPEQPHLYRLEVCLEAQPEDLWQEPFGFRTIEARDGRLYLNGHPLMLRGALDQDYYPHLIYTPPSEDILMDQLRKAKEMGLNCMRVHIKVPDPRYYQLADELGLLIWTELPNWKHLTETARRRGKETLAGILERDWNHPSIIIWTIINEDWGTNLSHDPQHRVWLAEMYAWMKQQDPLRLVVDNSACYTNFHVVTDIEDFHNYYAIPDHYDSWRLWVAAFANRAPWVYAPVFDGSDDWCRYVESPWEHFIRPAAPEVKARGDEPLIISEFGNWGLPDLDQLRACYGGKDPWWFETGYEWSEGVVYPHGIERRFYDYSLNRVFGSLSELTLASQWSQFHAMKYEIEQMRRHQTISGYVITEFTDLHWESNGLLDMCRNPKVYHDLLPQINAEDMLIPEWQRLAYWPGETVSMELLLSHYSTRDLQGSRLRWRLEGDGQVSGELDGLILAPYHVTLLGRVSFTAPEVQRSRSDQLVFELLDSSGQVAARSSQVVYFMPRRDFSGVAGKVWGPDFRPLLEPFGLEMADRLDEARIALVYDLDEEVYRYAQGGGRVLWLAEKPQPESAYLSLPKICCRKGTYLQGDWASTFSWVRPGPVFTDLPTSGPVDFAFADLTPDNYIKGVLPMDFSRQVHAGIFAGWVQKNSALVADLPLGLGHVLISTFRLGENMGRHPVAAAMVSQMLHYLGQ